MQDEVGCHECLHHGQLEARNCDATMLIWNIHFAQEANPAQRGKGPKGKRVDELLRQRVGVPGSTVWQQITGVR